MVKVALQVYSSMTLAKLELLVKELFHYLQSKKHLGNYLKVVHVG